MFVADEVITGFGRTGPMFACEAEQTVPDLMTLAKGLTSGYAPMGALMVSDHVYDVIADGQRPGVPLGHGHTYSGHPVSAAVALEVLRLYTEGGVLENGQISAAHFETALAARLADHPLVGNVRSRGLLAAIELATDKKERAKPSPELNIPALLFERGVANGVLFRAFPDSVIGLAPPLSITLEEVDMLIARIEAALNDLLEVREIRSALE